MRRPILLLAILAAAAFAASCGDDDGPGHPTDGGTPVAPPSVVDTPTPTGELVLPSVPPLDDETARTAATVPEETVATDAVSTVALMALSERGAHEEAVRIARETMLLRAGDEYADPYAAAIGLEVLLAAGAPGAKQEALALAEWFLAADEPEISVDVVSMLARVDGAERTRAEALLARIAEVGDDVDDALAAVYALAERKGAAHLETLAAVARDTQRTDGIRAAAAAGLLGAGDPRGDAVLESLLATPDADLVDLLSGLSVRGVRQVLPYVRRGLERAIARGSAEPEFDAACYALADAFAGGQGEPAREAIRTWLAKDARYEGDAATYALWMLGDESRADGVRRILVREIASYGSHDVELAVLLLDEIGARGLARDETFRDAVDAAAQISVPPGGAPFATSRLRWLKIAAANAYLRSPGD